MKNIKFEDLLERLQAWGGDNLLTTNALYQLILICVAYVVGAVVYRIFRPKITQTVENAKLPARIKRVLNNLHRLLGLVITLGILGLALAVSEFEFFTIESVLTRNVMKVMAAWIVIRLALEFVRNKIVRNIFAFCILIVAVLSIFNVLPQTMTALDAFGFNLGTFRLSALSVIKGALSLFVLLYIALFFSTFAERQVLRTKSLTRSSQVLVAKIVRIILIVLAFIIAITSAGIDLSIFAVLSGAIGLGIGFGLQKVVSNLFSGMLLLLDKSIQPGDVIELETSGTFGWVKHMGARYTEIITRDNKSYLIPNEDFVTQTVVNWSHDNDRLVRIAVEFGVHYDSDIHHVIKIAKEAATKPDRVVEKPEPVCWITEFGDSSVNFTLRFWIKDAEGGVSNVRGGVLLALWDALQEHNIEIPYPQRVVHMAAPSQPPPKPKKKPATKKKEKK